MWSFVFLAFRLSYQIWYHQRQITKIWNYLLAIKLQNDRCTCSLLILDGFASARTGMEGFWPYFKSPNSKFYRPHILIIWKSQISPNAENPHLSHPNFAWLVNVSVLVAKCGVVKVVRELETITINLLQDDRYLEMLLKAFSGVLVPARTGDDVVWP